jgi:hypothetical protein
VALPDFRQAACQHHCLSWASFCRLPVFRQRQEVWWISDLKSSYARESFLVSLNRRLKRNAVIARLIRARDPGAEKLLHEGNAASAGTSRLAGGRQESNRLLEQLSAEPQADAASRQIVCHRGPRLLTVSRAE